MGGARENDVDRVSWQCQVQCFGGKPGTLLGQKTAVTLQDQHAWPQT